MNRWDELTRQKADCDEAGDFAFEQELAAIDRFDYASADFWHGLRKDAFMRWMALHAECALLLGVQL